MTKNYTILTASGKKTVVVPFERPRFNETIANKLNYLADIYSKKLNNTKLISQIEIIKNIFALKNRTLNRAPIPSTSTSTTTTTISTKTSTTTSTTTTTTLQTVILTTKKPIPISNDYGSNEELINKQFENYFDNIETTTVNINEQPSEKTHNNDTVDRNDENDADYYGVEEDSLENEDLSVIDSDLLLNLQLNTFNANKTGPNNINMMANKKKKKSKSKSASSDDDMGEDNEEANSNSDGNELTLSAHSASSQNNLRSSADSNLVTRFNLIYSLFIYAGFFLFKVLNV